MLRHEHADRKLLERLAPAEIRSRTVEALLDIIEAISRESPVIVIEDVHWIDPSTSELMTRLARLIRELPVLLVATMRPGETPRWAEERDANLLHLTRLQPQEIRRLVNAMAAEHKMPSAIVDAIVARSDGIPIFAEELARGYQAIETVAPGSADAHAIPATLNETLLARLDLLEYGRETAQFASAIGRDVPVALLVAVSPFGGAEMAASIERLIEAGIFVKRHSPFGEAIEFRHSLLRDAAYHLLLRRDRLEGSPADRGHDRDALPGHVRSDAARAGASAYRSRRRCARRRLVAARRQGRSAALRRGGSGCAFFDRNRPGLEAAAGR